MFNYAVILIVASVIIAVILVSLAILGWCTSRSFSVIQSLPRSSAHIPFDDKLSSCMSLDSYSMTFQYKAEEAVEGTAQTECIICLAPFEEEESVRLLHSCNHIFHTPCIDMWLGSHSGCPLCRTQIDQVSSPNGIVKVPLSNGSVASDHENGQMILLFVRS